MTNMSNYDSDVRLNVTFYRGEETYLDYVWSTPFQRLGVCFTPSRYDKYLFSAHTNIHTHVQPQWKYTENYRVWHNILA